MRGRPENGRLAFDEIFLDRKSDTGTVTLSNLPGCRDLDRRVDDVLRPVTLTRGDITRQRKIRKAGKSDVMRASDARLQHAYTPYRYTVIPADIVYAPRFPVPA